MITVKVKGTEDLIKQIRKAGLEVHEKARKVLNEQAKIIRDDIKQKCPVKSGTLQKSVRSISAKKTLNAGVSMGGGKAHYAPFVEFGTKYVDAQPFFFPTARKHEQETQDKLVEALDQTLKEASGE